MGLFDSFFSKAPAAPKMNQYDPNAGMNGVVNQSQYIPGLNNLVNNSNKSFQDSIGSLLPGYQEGLATSAKNTNSLLAGQLPQDVQDQLYRSSAYQAMSNGTGYNSGMGRDLTLRDFGLNSLQAMQQGQQMMGQNLGFANMLTPSRVNQFLQGPGYFQQISNSNMDIQNQNAAIGYANSMRKSPFETFLNNIPGMALNAGMQAGMGMATGGMSSFMGMGGGGGGSSFNSDPYNNAFNSLYSNRPSSSFSGNFGGLQY